jgi:hypothetical protein
MTTKDPADLRVHPLKRQMPRGAEWQKGGEQFNELTDDIREHGIRQPLILDVEGQILDGELRLLVAKQLQLKEVPVVVVKEAAATVILGSMLRRQHLTKSARAYLAYPLIEVAHQEAKARAHENLRKGNTAPARHGVAGSNVSDFANSIGISYTLFKYAAQVHQIFKSDPEFKSTQEPKILSDDPEQCIGLGRVIAGHSGRIATKDKEKGDRGQLRLFQDVVEDAFIRIKYWTELADTDRKQVWSLVDKMAAESAPEHVKEMADFHAEMAARLRKMIKESAAK